MTKDNLNHLQCIGLTNYVREGRHPLPPIKLVKAYQMAVKNTCDHSKHSDGKYSSRGEQKKFMTLLTVTMKVLGKLQDSRKKLVI